MTTLRRIRWSTSTKERRRCRSGTAFVAWILDLLQRKPPKLVAVALANKLARIAWKLMVTGEAYAATRAPVTTAGA